MRSRLTELCDGTGFSVFGGFAPDPTDGVPEIEPGRSAMSLFLIGNAGGDLWQPFEKSPEFSDGVADPLDRYVKRTLSLIAGELSLSAIFVSDGPPFYPFQQWALKAGGFSPSPAGVLTHRIYGPWAAFRAAFLSADEFVFDSAGAGKGPCPSCADKPCLSACPVGAISLEGGYDVPRCRDHITGWSGDACMGGCLVRHACPYGVEYAHQPKQARFHMDSFLRLSRPA